VWIRPRRKKEDVEERKRIWERGENVRVTVKCAVRLRDTQAVFTAR